MIDLRTLYPLDLETVNASVRRTGRAVIVDESSGYGGVSAELAASSARLVQLPGRPGQQGAPPALADSAEPRAAQGTDARRRAGRGRGPGG